MGRTWETRESRRGCAVAGDGRASSLGLSWRGAWWVVRVRGRATLRQRVGAGSHVMRPREDASILVSSVDGFLSNAVHEREVYAFSGVNVRKGGREEVAASSRP